MTNLRSANRYALAILSVAEELDAVESVSRDFAFLEKLVVEVKEFALFLRSPVINHQRKRQVLTIVLTGNVGELVAKFVLLLAAKGREGLLVEIVREFYRLRDARLGILNVEARSAAGFTEAQQRELVRRLEAATGKKARVRYAVDRSLQGGFTVQLEDTVWDASVRHQLELLRQRFAEASL